MTNPKECYFIVFREEGNKEIHAAITPMAYFDSKGALDDCFNDDIEDWCSVSEAVYHPGKKGAKWSMEDAHLDLLIKGYTYIKGLADFMEEDGAEVFRP